MHRDRREGPSRHPCGQRLGQPRLVAAPGDVGLEPPGPAAHNPPLNTAIANTRAWRAAEIPAGGGTGNARSVARIHAILACGDSLISPSTCRRALDVQVEGVDLILGLPIRFGLGFAVGGDFMPSPNTLYWGGAGGSLAVIDLDARATYAYTMNKMAGGLADLRAFGPMTAAWSAA
ncbi:serine hydrolase [Actinoplanes sp. CA-054009]